MTAIKIEGIPPWDGEYPFDISFFTNRELHLINEIANVRAGELGEEFERGNNDLVVAIALIATKRNDKTIPPDELWDAKAGAITLVGDTDADAVPPGKPTENDAEPNDSSDPSGSDSGSTGGRSQALPLVTGTRGLVTGAESSPVTEPEALVT